MFNSRIPILRSFLSINRIVPQSKPLIIPMVNTRSKIYTYGEELGEQQKTNLTSEPLSNRRRRWTHLLHAQHFQPLIAEVLEKELPKYKQSTMIDATNRVSQFRDCALLLSSAPSVFAAAVEGNLVSRMLSDPALQTEYTAVLERAHHQPSIYIHLLTDRYGTAPTPNQYLTIRDMVHDYLAEGQASEHAWQLDSTTHPTVSKQLSALGHRKYLHTSIRSSKRVDTLQRFCRGVQKRWQETPASLRDTPFLHPPGECGYSKDSHIRLAQHRAHQSSNYVMNLVEDICTYLHRTGIFEQHFTMHQFIVFLIFRPSQAAIAEIFCSGLLQVWVEDGGGFNAYPAGRSVATAKKVSEDEWAVHERCTRQESLVVENMRVQRQRAEEWRNALEWGDGAWEYCEMRGGSAKEDEYECL
jgi:hypothetical protein